VIATAQSELSREMAAHGCAALYTPGDPRSLADQIVSLARDRGRARRMGALGREWTLTARSSAATTAALRKWAAAPAPAADRASGHAHRRALRHAEIVGERARHSG
jgi:hypothetical protein